jgi:fructose-bisphosphate aldolase class I
MNAQALMETARALVAGDKGLLAMDESNPTCDRRFARAGIPQTVEARRAYRELILTTGGLGDCINGAILYDETIRQHKKDGTSFVKILLDAGVIPGIKVDIGAQDLAGHPGEKITEGLDGLRDRLKDYFQMGARFAKWRAVITMGEGLPSWGCIEANAHALARYAVLCQEVGLVPIVEPEVLVDGDQSLEQRRAATESVLQRVFAQLHAQGAMLEGMILKPNMALSGLACATQASVDEVAEEAAMGAGLFLCSCDPAASPGNMGRQGSQSGSGATGSSSSGALQRGRAPRRI